MDVSLLAKTKPLSSLSAFSYVPPRRSQTKDMSYFNRDLKDAQVSTYDLVFHQAEGYDMKLHRDDRRHHRGRGLDINAEERSRSVPILSSSEYGHRPVPVLYEPGRQHPHVARIKTEFYVKNGLAWNVEEGYGSVVPI